MRCPCMITWLVFVLALVLAALPAVARLLTVRLREERPPLEAVWPIQEGAHVREIVRPWNGALCHKLLLYGMPTTHGT